MEILLPKRIQKKVQQDAAAYANVTHLSNNISAYYTLSPCFFPDYTIHGTDHVNVVLDLADHLIPDETMDYLSPKEMAILTAAIMIHDIGMFITEDGLERILTGIRSGNLVQNLDSQSWCDAWTDYCQKIKRCTDRELFRAFGDKEPIESICTLRNEMCRKDYLVCGEFIRQQHHRLAHEIALNGFMGSTDVDIFKNTDFTQNEKDLIGLIARSHGMSIRDTESYLESIFANIAFPLNIHLFYLMAVLRIADYLDAGQHRAPKVLQDRQEIDGSISQGEWLWNRIIRYKDYLWSADHMSLVIQASPGTTSLFAKTEKWLHGLQQELDLSWAIIMEYYPKKNIELSIHRIESNILKETTRVAMSQRFLIKEARLTANPDLLKLLIGPLYGNDPSFGVRELLQNAVDACTERKYLEQDENYCGKVTISIDSTDKTITITDNGVGMNEDVLRNYYLSVGSSYRYSDNWMADFTQDREAHIVRSGRFGVGVLSIFLLGASAHIETRHLKDNRGYVFDFAMDQESIDVQRIDCVVGTTQTVKLSDAALDCLRAAVNSWKKILTLDFSPASKRKKYSQIKWYEWYAFKEPEVRYYWDGEEINPLEFRTIVPHADNEDPTWSPYNSPDYESFQWKYCPDILTDKAYCNGILIHSINDPYIGADTGMMIRTPSISIVDRMTRLSIDLSRSTIFEFPDKNGFALEAYRYLLAKLLLTKWKSREDNRIRLQGGFAHDWCGFESPSYAFSKQGFTLNHATFLAAANIRQLLCLGYPDDIPLPNFCDIQTTVPIVFTPIKESQIGPYIYEDFMRGSGPAVNFVPYRTWINAQGFDANIEAFVAFLCRVYRERPTCPGYYRYDLKIAKEPPISFVEEYLDVDDIPIAAEYRFNFQKMNSVPDYKNILRRMGYPPDDKNIMLELLRNYLGQDIWIPIEMDERIKKFPKAFEELQYYIKRLED